MVVNEDLYEQSLTILESHPRLQHFVGPKPPDLIARAEAALALTFPSTYRRFLSSLGCGNFGSFEVFGIVDKDFIHSSVPDGVWYTMKERERGLPLDFVVIGDSGDGWLFCLNCGENRLPKFSVGAYPVSDVIEIGSFEVAYKSFDEFFYEGVKRVSEGI